MGGVGEIENVTYNTVKCNCNLKGIQSGLIYGYLGIEYELWKKGLLDLSSSILNTSTVYFTIADNGWTSIEDEQFTYDVPSHTFDDDSGGNPFTIVIGDELYFIATIKNVAIHSEVTITSDTTVIDSDIGGDLS